MYQRTISQLDTMEEGRVLPPLSHLLEEPLYRKALCLAFEITTSSQQQLSPWFIETKLSDTAMFEEFVALGVLLRFHGKINVYINDVELSRHQWETHVEDSSQVIDFLMHRYSPTIDTSVNRETEPIFGLKPPLLCIQKQKRYEEHMCH